MTRIHTEFTSDSKSIEAALDRQHRELVKLKEDYRKLKEESKRAGQEQQQATTSMEGGVAAIGKMALAYVSVHSAIQLVNAELRQQIELQEKAAKAQVSVGGSRAAFLRNAGGLTAEERQAAVARVEDIAATTGIDQRELFPAAGAALSAAGAGTSKDALAAVETAARFVPEGGGDLSKVAGGLLDTASLTKSFDAVENLGVLAAAQAKSRVESAAAVAQNIIPAAINVQAFGGTSSEALGLVTAMTNALKDQQGAVSGTASIALAEQLDKFFRPADIQPSAGETKLSKGQQAQQAEVEARRAAGAGADSTAERIALLQSRPDLAAQFLADASFEKKAGKQVELLLTDANSEVARLARDFTAAIPSGAGARKLGEEQLATIQNDPLVRQTRLAGVLGGTADRLLTENLGAGEAGIARDKLQEVLEATGVGAMEERLLTSLFEFNSDVGGQGALNELEARIKDRARVLRTVQAGFDMAFAGAAEAGVTMAAMQPAPPAPGKPGSPEAIRQADVLDQLLGTIRDMRAGASPPLGGVDESSVSPAMLPGSPFGRAADTATERQAEATEALLEETRGLRKDAERRERAERSRSGPASPVVLEPARR